MQQGKNTKKFELCGSNLQDNEKIAFDIHKTLELFKIHRTGEFFDSVKRCGFAFSSLLPVLLLLPFYGISSISSLVINNFQKMNGVSCGKTTIYEMKNNEKIAWRSLLMLVALRFKTLNTSIVECEKQIRALIIDDSTLPKTGKNIEYVSRVYDHVFHTYVFGFKVLVMGFWDGKGFHPIDFSLHREKGRELEKAKDELSTQKNKLKEHQKKLDSKKVALKQAQKQLTILRKALKISNTKKNQKKIESIEKKITRLQKNYKLADKQVKVERSEVEKKEQEVKKIKKLHPSYGLSDKEKKQQYSKSRKSDTAGYKRAMEVDFKKTDMAIDMLRRAVRRGFNADYVLVDTWFCNLQLLKVVLSVNKKVKMHFLAMAKMGTTKYTLLANGKDYNAHELLSKFERKSSVCRSHKARYIKVKVKWDGIRVNLFFVKFGSNAKWRLLITSDLSLDFIKLIEIYQIRWTIEVFFREAKQYLGLGKCQSTCFDAQIADITIIMIQYSLVAFHKKIHENQTFGELFRELSKGKVILNLQIEIVDFCWKIIDTLDEMIETDNYKLSKNIIRNPDKFEKLINLVNESCLLKRA